MKKAFTLIELLVVVGIIAILIGVLAVNMIAGGDTARAAKCLTNLKNLSTAVGSCVMAGGCYPGAGSFEGYRPRSKKGGGIEKGYYEVKGWISWNSQGGYGANPTSSICSGGWNASAYCQDPDVREYCLTNGALWKFVGGNREIYTCPAHVRKMPARQRPAWSYVMNGYFKCQNPGRQGLLEAEPIKASTVSRADRRLLFAELDWESKDAVITESAGSDCDCTLQYKDCTDYDCAEQIAFNHKEGKELVAHVIFADGHVEKLRQPRRGLGEGELKELTKLLCKGKDVSFNGQTYEEMK